MKENNDKHEKRTWGNVEPGPLNEGEAAALKPMQDNAAKCEVKPTNMDPEPAEGGISQHSEESIHCEWQKLSSEEKDKFSERKDGYPKN